MNIYWKTLLTCIVLTCLVTGCADTQARQQNIFTGAGTGRIDEIPTESYLEPSLQTDIGYSSGSGWRITNFFIIGKLFGNQDNTKHVADAKAMFTSDEQYLKACWFAAHRANQQATTYNDTLKAIIVRHVTWVQSLRYKPGKLNMPVSPATQDKEKQTLNQLLNQQEINTRELKSQIARYMAARIKGRGASAKTRNLLDHEIKKLKQAAEEMVFLTWDIASLLQLL